MATDERDPGAPSPGRERTAMRRSSPDAGPDSDTAPVLVSCAKDEALFLLEWVAYHHAIGFGAIILCTNDCSDGTDAIADALHRLGVIEHHRNAVPPGAHTQEHAIAHVLAREDVRARNWMLFIDIDEFLNVTTGDGHLDDFLATVPSEADVVALRWRSYGDGSETEWMPGLVLEKYTSTQPAPLDRLRNHKSLYRPWRFAAGNEHMPKAVPGTQVVLVNSAGAPMRTDALFDPEQRRFRNRPRLCSWENACINHYALKSRDVFLLKNVRGANSQARRDATKPPERRLKYRINGPFWRRNRGTGAEDRTIQRLLPATRALMAQWRAEAPEIVALEAEAMDRLAARRQIYLRRLDSGDYRLRTDAL